VSESKVCVISFCHGRDELAVVVVAVVAVSTALALISLTLVLKLVGPGA
jgi:hypothetical protein